MSRLRITGGRARGRVIRLPVGPGVRPTSGRVREALFSMLGQDLDGVRWLDAYGGTGLMGMEAWSRGAQVAVVERNPRVARSIRQTAQQLGAALDVHVGDVTKRIGKLGPVDIIFADPPYALPVAPILEALAPHAKKLVLEAASATTVPGEGWGLVRVLQRSYGSTTLHVFEAS